MKKERWTLVRDGSLKTLGILGLLAPLILFDSCSGVSSSGNGGNSSNHTASPSQLSATSSSLSFGTVTLGGGKSLSETITNSGASSIAISQVTVSGTGFSVSGISAPMSLSPGQGATFNVVFSPSTTGSVSGNVTITSSASDAALTIPLGGTGTASVAAGELSISPPGTLPVGSVAVGSSGNSSGSLTANGASVTITAASINNAAFSLSGLSLPVTIPAGHSVPFTVTFSPSNVGVATATLTLSSNAQSAFTQETLTGTGTDAPTYSVSLSWDASDSSEISGYNVYRAIYTNACGSFSKINSVLDTSTAYTDTVVVDGTAYCYATTAVNTSNQESGYSNIVSNLQIPAP